MSEINNGGPAFPLSSPISFGGTVGMTLRDYFAAKAMNGMMADSSNVDPTDELARYSYMIADAMLKARKE